MILKPIVGIVDPIDDIILKGFVIQGKEVIDALPTSFIDSNVSLRWKQQKSKELRHAPWLATLWG